MKALVSVPWTWSFGDPPAHPDAEVSLLMRTSDWGLSKHRARMILMKDALRLAGRARGNDAVVLSTLGAEAGLLAWLCWILAPKARILVFDFLAPRSEVGPRVARWLFARIDKFLVIRSGDVAMLGRRFGLPPTRTAFLRWPVRDGVPDADDDGDYIYAAGWAHRDWPTLVAALAATGLPARIAPGHAVEVPPGAAVTVLDMPTPEEGRALAAAARVVAVVMKDTDLPSGPLVLLDALAMGKAVVVSDVNGSRDYVVDGQTALVVPPGDPAALGRALTLLFRDGALRQRLGRAARHVTLRDSSLALFWGELSKQCH